MAHDDSASRNPATVTCVYWNGSLCIATGLFPEDDISCFHEGNCDGFGTCRDCTVYDVGGLKLGQSDGDGGKTQTPLNLKVYNLRARIAPCCFWDGAPGDFSKDASGKLSPVYFPVSTDESDPEATIEFPASFDAGTSEETKCTLAAAAPWQTLFTEDNPTAYGCNGAKAECPFYTGPKFTEVVDDKMELGNRVTAKQIMELRFYSDNWKEISDPRAEWERRFEQPDIWAWARDGDATNEAGGGATDGNGNPLVQRVTISDLNTDTPTFDVDPSRPVSEGTETVGGVPNFPSLVRELLFLSTGMEVLWPADTEQFDPFVRKTFTSSERNQYIAVLINSDRPAYAVNLAKRPQGGESDQDFILRLQREFPEDVVPATVTGLPGKTFAVPLVASGSIDTLNNIRIYLDTGADDGSMRTANVYVRHIFYHGHVAQTAFIDRYGHAAVDPWINHFTDMRIEADFLRLTGNANIYDVLWNTIASNGKKTMYALEEQVVTSSEGNSISWEPIGCGHIVVTFNDNTVNRVYPWKAWDNDSQGVPLYVRVDRSGNSDVEISEPQEVEMELSLTSSKGTAIPANIAIFKLPTDTAVRPFDNSKDVLRVRYAYTDYKQGPIAAGDVPKLKFQDDATKIIDQLVYDITFDDNSMAVEGTFIRAGSARISSCDEVIGECYRQKALDNEQLAQTVFFAGGLGEEDVKSNAEMIDECAATFNASTEGTFDDGVPVSYNETVNRLGDIHLSEGDQKYSVIFKDEEGRPIGTKQTAFLLQSAMVQARDVEVRYKWAAHAQHYPTNDGMILLANLYAPMFATQNRLVRLLQEYDPHCGDHAETTVGNPSFRAFDISIDQHGPLWFPFKRCFTPQYHADSTGFVNTVEYEDIVEGFGATPEINATGNRRDYWERMRFWDQYMPAIMNWINNIGCFWTERTTTINVNQPVNFTGYTKIRSTHPFGLYASDRESLRLSRHWQKRNLSVREEVIKQEDDGLSVRLTDDFVDILYDPETGTLNEDSELETPVWVHMNDGVGIVVPGTEAVEHPFNHLILSKVGNYTFTEIFSEARLAVSAVFEERDYTSSEDRSEDGTKIYLPDGTDLNVVEGFETAFVEEKKGSDVRWAFKADGTGWAWMVEPPDPIRGSPRITGLFVSNPARVLFKKNFEPAVQTTEGVHTLSYTPAEVTASGSIDVGAKLRLDGGPELYISQTDGQIFILSDPASPYDPAVHTGADYEFVLHGNGPGGVGILADNRGLQLYEAGGEPFATLAGVNINVVFDLDELPFELEDVRNVSRLSGSAGGDTVDEAIRDYSSDEVLPFSVPFNFWGHYYVESVVVTYRVGGVFDKPVFRLDGVVKDTGVASAEDADPTQVLVPSTSYVKGQPFPAVVVESQTLVVRQRLFSLELFVGARLTGRELSIQNIVITVRNSVARTEEIEVFEPRVQKSTSLVGTHKPSDLEFYFQRTYPDFAKDYLSGQLSMSDQGFTNTFGEGQGSGGTSITAIAGTEIKFTGRQIKDIIPQFEFSDPINNRFPYNSIDITAIPGYTERTDAAGTTRFIDSTVAVSSKGWTMVTSEHFDDPLDSLIATEFGPEGLANVYPENSPVEDLQPELYRNAGALLGDKVARYSSFWHPAEEEFFSDSGVDLAFFSWSLTLTSAVASVDKVFRHQDYGCHPETTNENLDGHVHTLSSWHAKGAFHFLCDARFSWACLTTVMNKCNQFIFNEYGTQSYIDNDVIDRFTYVFAFPPRDYQSYKSSNLINQNEVGGIIGGTGPIGSAVAASAPAPTLSQLHQNYNTNLPPKGPGDYA